jgi:hypothetical protein
MFNVKWSGIAAGVAFALALALSLSLGQTNLLTALLRAAIFAALFFGLATAAWVLINSFIPELLSSSTPDIANNLFSTGTAGSRVNITVDDTNAALPAGGNDVGDFNELFTPKNTHHEDSQDIDQTPVTGYTEEGEVGEMGEFASTGGFAAETEEFASAFDDDAGLSEEGEEKPGEFSMDFSAFVPSGLGDDGDEDGNGETGELDPDLGALSFFPEAVGGGPATFEEADVPERKVSRNKPMKLEGDFNAKEIAAGLRTVLEKDKK